MKASSPRSIRWRQESRSPNGSKVFRDERLNAGASVYHYLEYPHALSVFSEGRLRLANPLTWSDPYENWWNKTLFDRPSPLQQARPYALCWTRSRFDGPAWRMTGFQRTNPIVRIRCRVRDLLAAATALAAERPGTFFTGNVFYDRDEDLSRRASSVQAGEVKDVARVAANLLLRKRNAFRFEKEVRILWLDHEPQRTALFLPIDAKTVIKQVMCSPHMHPDQRSRIGEEFMERFGVDVIDGAQRVPIG